MCGITGIIMKDFTSVEVDQLKIMNDRVQHRGPDGEGFYHHENVGFGHRRLSILDLSALGSQPMKYGESLIITYNGEIYNYIEIRAELVSRGHIFKSGSDTEVILASYQEWGSECVHRFNGMWAFAIHDIEKKIVFISRDRFGVKPFYYFESQNKFMFGSEIRQLLTQVTERKVDRQMLFDYLYLGYHHHTHRTFFENIFSLDPGHNMVFDLSTGSHTISKWYKFEINDDINRLSFDNAQKLFETTLDNAIHLRLRSDVKVGTCLSGGLDSSYIAAVAAVAYNSSSSEKFNAITAKSIEKDNDETVFAEMVVNHSDLKWKVVCPQPEDFFSVVEDVIETQEEPFGGPSIIMQYFVMKKAKDEGCIVLLDGQGGDEALLGYDRYYSTYLGQLKGIVNKIKCYLEISRNSKLSMKDLFLYMLYFNNTRVRAMRQLRRNDYIKPEFKSYLNIDLLSLISRAGKKISDLQELEITKVQLQKLLKYEDRNSMRFSIEARVPFVDYRVMELSYSLPVNYKINNGWSKYILRKSAEAKLPKGIVWRKAKIGFEAPNNWYQNRDTLFRTIEQSEFLGSFVNKDKILKSIDDVSLWKLYNLAVWAKKFNVQF
jgi:asparagine synthase (glutamine-hydrolysing)